MAGIKQNGTPDQRQRDAAIAERDRNALVDAGAGTGKTTILVDRLVEMVAPSDEGRATPISRIAAITFTRKAAGELRLRIRERLLRELSEVRADTIREARLREAIADLDTAYVGTIHSFADRLLRLRPVEAGLSPSYEIAEDDQALIRETFQVLLQAVQSGTLTFELEGTDVAGRAGEATQTALDALYAGLRADSQEMEWFVRYGLDALVEGFIRSRDVPPPDVPAISFDKVSFRTAAEEFVKLTRPVKTESQGANWIRRTATVLAKLCKLEDPIRIFRETRQQLDRAPRNVTKRDTFAGEDDAWQAWRVYTGQDKRRPRPLKEDLCAPLNRWMATRLVRLFPVVIAIYETVKARRRQLDQLDLLVKLRNLLANDKPARAEYQRRFDHIFVDEFQDTDPLQAEIVLYLCECEARAERWEDVLLSPGTLTLVGDPKQSIYRFRRADIAMYERVRNVVAKQNALEVKLSANFRSVPPLIEWLNDRFARILGTSPDENFFDPATGKVFQQPLAAGREGAAQPAVRILPFGFDDGGKPGVDEYRSLEGRVLARYLRWLVEKSDVSIIDPLDGRRRRILYGDIAILAVSTWRLSPLFSRLDAEGIPYASRGGTLFLEDPLHRQFLLGLRALADRDDGVAEAALLRPPFFAVDLADLLREKALRAAGSNGQDERVTRALAARELVRELRQRRFDQSPGTTARELLDRTAFARAVALGPNGAQRLARLRELCHILEKIAANERLDYDAATARVREWIDKPVQLDPPHPVGAEAVRVMTVHQAKGLEFPVVAIWDGKGQWDARLQSSPWSMERDGRGWMINLDGLTWEEPADLGIRDAEQSYLNAERRRVGYVAATRARDLLIVPKAGDVSPGKFICGDLLAEAPEKLMQTMQPYIDGKEPVWSRQLKAIQRKAPGDGSEVEKRVASEWEKVSVEAARPRFRPVSVSGLGRMSWDADGEETLGTVPQKEREGRFGGVFGNVVHHAIGLVLRNEKVAAPEAVERAAKLYDLTEHIEEAFADVRRAREALGADDLGGPVGPNLQLEYPVAGQWADGQLVNGYIDLVAVNDANVTVIDFKTDTPPNGAIKQAYPKYAAQVRIYGKLLEAAGVLKDRQLRCGLLFTAERCIHWVEP
ncbi:MAG: UvrD-helicase domain-containing protein [Candidatus Binatia bacterium]